MVEYACGLTVFCQSSQIAQLVEVLASSRRHSKTATSSERGASARSVLQPDLATALAANCPAFGAAASCQGHRLARHSQRQSKATARQQPKDGHSRGDEAAGDAVCSALGSASQCSQHADRHSVCLCMC